MIRIGILGYGNLGRGVELSIGQNPDMQLTGIFTRRDPASVKTAGGKVYYVDALLEKKDEIDVLILCGGSATDLPEQSPAWAKHFHIVDSFDNHSRIPAHFAACDAAAQGSFHTALISAGWDPGMFSLQRVLGECALPQGKSYTFWGKGISQGHSDAIRRVEGVADARVDFGFAGQVNILAAGGQLIKIVAVFFAEFIVDGKSLAESLLMEKVLVSPFFS